MPARVPISMAAPVPSDPTGRCPRGRPRKIPAAPPATERVPSGENLSGVPEHNPVPPGPPDDDVAITKIGEEAGTFLGVSRRAFAVVISDIADHLQCMLVERQQIESKMSAAAIAIQRSSGRTWTGVLCQAMRVVARRDRLEVRVLFRPIVSTAPVAVLGAVHKRGSGAKTERSRRPRASGAEEFRCRRPGRGALFPPPAGRLRA